MSGHFTSRSAEEAIFKNAPTPWARVSKEGKFLAVNKAMLNLFGWTEDQMLGFRWQDITRATDIAPDEVEAAKLISGQETSYSMEKEYEHKDGIFFWAWLTVNGVYDDDGNLIEFVSWIIPVSRAKINLPSFKTILAYKKAVGGIITFLIGIALLLSGKIKFSDLVTLLPKLLGF